MIEHVVKNSGRIEPFQLGKIKLAIGSALVSGSAYSSSEKLNDDISEIFSKAVNVVNDSLMKRIHVMDIHDAVERAFMSSDGFFEAGRSYIKKRDEKRRKGGRPIYPDVREAFDTASSYFPTQIQQFQFFNKYSRFSHELGRRETWVETVDRVVSFLKELSCGKLSDSVFVEIQQAMLRLEVMPSMRLVAMAGEAARRNNISIYNCSYQGIDDPYAFVETLIISMAGCGAGYSVESKFIDRLPAIGRSWAQKDGVWTDESLSDSIGVPRIVLHEDPNATSSMHVVEDSSMGWARAMWTGLVYWWNGCDTISFDYSKVRPAGSVLKIKGGTSSGPEPLKRMLDYMRDKLLSKKGNKLSPIDAHDIQCIIGDCVIQGGVRRSAMISIFDWDDQEMKVAKSGNWFSTHPHRSNANNSRSWKKEVSNEEVREFVLEMDASGSGENGIFSRHNFVCSMSEGRKSRLSSKELEEIGVNPCGEIVLLSGQFCNLSIAVARPEMSVRDLSDSVRLATIIGTIQSAATNFPGLRDKWRMNCEKERLIGVDITGQADVDYLTAPVMERMRRTVKGINEIFSLRLGIYPAASSTCCKPNGNSSVLLDSSPGLNRRWSPYQIRRTRLSANCVMAKVLKASGMKLSPENGQREVDATTLVASWPMKAPDGALTTRSRCAIQQCEAWKRNKLHYTTHNPSITVTYHPDELESVISWVTENKKIIGGMAFLPASESNYDQLPNEEITKEEYEKLSESMPEIDFAKLYAFEHSDTTTSAQELACMSGSCELDF